MPHEGQLQALHYVAILVNVVNVVLRLAELVLQVEQRPGSSCTASLRLRGVPDIAVRCSAAPAGSAMSQATLPTTSNRSSHLLASRLRSRITLR
jgi:hypothetical protein